jgi:DNA ligase-1
MRLFTQLYQELDGTTRTNEKVAALERYFRAAPPEDAVWALHFLTGRKVGRGVTNPQLRALAAQVSGLPEWLVEESYDAVGDLAETLALLLPDQAGTQAIALHELVEARLVPLRKLTEPAREEVLMRTWRELDGQERFLWHKLITGGFRVGVARTLVARALARVAGVEPSIMAHRLMGDWQPTPAHFARLLAGSDSAADVGKPYPFFLAHPLEGTVESLGPVTEWQIEWKWDGIRAQLLQRQGQVLLWSRGEELITDQFPELAEAARVLPPGTVLDGEVLAWRGDTPLPFGELQKRLGRKRVDAKLRQTVPVGFMVYDLLEVAGVDWRSQSLRDRRARLDQLLASLSLEGRLFTSPLVTVDSWDEVKQRHTLARERRVEGLMLKRAASSYSVGRPRGDWWKWKVDPFLIDAVLINAQTGHGRRAGLYTDYTFAVWDAGRLVPIAKAYSGLTDEEIGEVDAFIKGNTLDRFGPVRVVKPELVFELAFEGIQASPRHKSGIALRFPRMNRRRLDKKADEADRLATLFGLLKGNRGAD